MVDILHTEERPEPGGGEGMSLPIIGVVRVSLLTVSGSSGLDSGIFAKPGVMS